jgi:PAS domain S-box-containing protein
MDPASPHDEHDDEDDVRTLREQQELVGRLAAFAVTGSGALDDVFGLACALAAHGTGVERAKLMVHDHERDDLVIEAAYGWGPEVIGERTRSDLRSPGGRALRTRTPVVVGDIRRSPDLDAVPPLDRYGIQACIDVPLIIDQHALGVLEIDGDEPTHLRRDGVRFLESLASIVAGAILRFEGEERYRSLFSSIDTAFCLLQFARDGEPAPGHRLVDANPAFRIHAGVGAGAMRFLEGAAPGEPSWMDRFATVAATRNPVRFQAVAATGRWYAVHAFAIGRRDARCVAILFNDITASKQAELRARESEGRLRIALRAAHMGTWVCQVPSRRQTIDESLCVLMGVDAPARIRTLEEFIGRIHPDDRDRVRADFEEALQGVAPLSTEFRVVHPDGTVRWLNDQGALVHDDAGVPRFMTGACVDITERKEAELRLQRTDRAKNVFLAMLAHELRNPMAAISNSVAVLQIDSVEHRYVEQAVAVIRRQTDHLARIVGDLLEVSRIEQGKIELAIAPLDFAATVRAGVETVQPLLAARRQKLLLDLPASGPRIEADGARIMQIVANLLHNASKFSDPGSEIAIRVAETPGTVTLTVRDAGVGIEPQMLERIFEIFEQGSERTLARSEGGLGIGLSLVRRLAEMHGGSVTARSEGKGRGASFEVRLPRQRPAG